MRYEHLFSLCLAVRDYNQTFQRSGSLHPLPCALIYGLSGGFPSSFVSPLTSVWFHPVPPCAPTFDRSTLDITFAHKCRLAVGHHHYSRCSICYANPKRSASRVCPWWVLIPLSICSLPLQRSPFFSVLCHSLRYSAFVNAQRLAFPRRRCIPNCEQGVRICSLPSSLSSVMPSLRVDAADS